MDKYQDTILSKFNVDEYGNPVTVALTESQMVGKKGFIQLSQFPDEFQRVFVQDTTGAYLTETQNAHRIGKSQYYVNYATGLVYFNPANTGKIFKLSYGGRGMELISTSRIFHKYTEEGDEIVETLTEIVDGLVEVSKDAINEELQRQQNEKDRISRFDAQMKVVQDEILDKDSAFQTQLQGQSTQFDALVKDVQTQMLGEDRLYEQHRQQQETTFQQKLEGWADDVKNLPGQIGGDIASLTQRLALDLNQPPIYHKTLRGVRTSVLQQFALLNDGSYLMSQVGSTETVSEGESFTITHLGKDGQVIDTMEILTGGHGWFQVVESEAGIELYFTSADERFIQTTYQANKILDLRQATGYQVLQNPTGERVLVAIDKAHDFILMMSRNEARVYDRADVYRFSEVKTGTATEPLYTLTGLLDEGDVMQGIGIDGQQAYFYSCPYGGTCKLRVFSLETATSTDYKYNQLGYAYEGDPSTKIEGEGMFIKDGILYIAVSVGASGSTRYNHIYAFSPVERQASILSDALENAQTFKLIEGNGFVKPVFVKPSRLDELTEPGEYYFSGSAFTFEDIPEEYRGKSGFFVHNSARAGDGTIFQTITRNTATGNCYRLGRQISGTTKKGAPWRSLTPEKKVLYTGDSRSLASIKLVDSIKNYDYILVRLYHAGGFYHSQLFDSSVLTTNKGLVLQATNLPDSASSANFYAQELACTISEDGLTINQTRKSQIQVTSTGTVNRIEDASIGICEIQGIRGFNVL